MTSEPAVTNRSYRGAKSERKPRLRIMTSGEVLDMALRIYQRLGLTFLRLTAVPSLLCLAATGFIQNFVLPGFFTTKASGSASQMLWDVSGAMACAILIGGPLFLLGLSFASSIVAKLVSDYLQGKPSQPDEAILTARAVLNRLFILNLKQLVQSCSGIVISTAVMAVGGYVTSITPQSNSTGGGLALMGILGLIAGFIVFLYFVAVDAVAVPVAIIEGETAWKTSKRSRELLKRVGYHPSGANTVWTAYFVLIFIAGVLWGGVVVVMELLNINERLGFLTHSGLPGHLVLEAIGLIPSFLVIWLLIPVWATIITIVYYERKIRLEGYDIDALASEILIEA